MSPLTLLIVITFILGAQSYTPYKEFDPYPFGSPNSCGPVSSSWINAVRNHLPVAQRSQLNTNATELSAFAEDYGHIYHRAPQVAFLARNTDDVVALVRAAKQLRNGANRFQIVPRGGSGNVQGGAQVSCDVKQVLLDTTGLSSVSITNLPLQKFAWLGAGTPWLDFITAAANVNLRPRVNPDYAGLTVGGLISAGGLGPDTAHVGPAVDQVLELEIVTPTGNRRLVGPRDEYFKAIRGGLGQFGIVTAVKYKLIANEADTRVYHVLTGNWTAYFATLQKFVDVLIPSKVDTVQSFVISNAEFNLEIFVAPAADLDAVRANVDAVLALPQPWVYFLELTIRGSENFLTTAQIGALLPAGMDPLLVFYTDEPTMSFDNRLKLFTVPALTANNGSWFKRHPWGSFCFPDSQIANFKTVIDNFDAFADSGFGLIAVYPYKTTKFSQNSFLSVPRTDDHFYHVTFGNNELTDTDAGLAHIAQKNRDIWDLLADTTIYPTVYIPDFGPTDWAKHFGTHWNQVKRIKKRLDPYFLLGDQRNFGFASLY